MDGPLGEGISLLDSAEHMGSQTFGFSDILDM